MDSGRSEPLSARLERAAKEAVALARLQVEEISQTAGQRALLATPFGPVATDPLLAASHPHLVECATLPLMIHGCLTGDEQPAIPLAAVSVLAYVGIDLLDAIMDGDPPAGWERADPGVLHLAGSTLIAAVVPLALSTLPGSPRLTGDLLRVYSAGLTTMSSGQQSDLESRTGAPPSPAEVLDAACRKSGGFTAMLASLAATFAGATPARIEAWRAMGIAWGTAGQVQSDVRDLLSEDGKDLVAGTCTLPVAFWLAGLDAGELPAAVELLRQARIDAAARQSVRSSVIRAGVLRDCGIVAALHNDRALRALERARPRQPWGEYVASAIRATSEG